MQNKIYTDKYGHTIGLNTLLYNPFCGEFWKVIEDDHRLKAAHIVNNYIVELDDIINTFIVAKRMYNNNIT